MAWAPGCRFTDPLAATTGYDELEAFLTGVRAQYAGHTFRLSSTVDAHHDVVRLIWDLVAPTARWPQSATTCSPWPPMVVWQPSSASSAPPSLPEPERPSSRRAT